MSHAQHTNGTTPQIEQPLPTLPAPPASGAARMISPAGIEWTITAHDYSVNGLVQKIEFLEEYLLNHDWQPAGSTPSAPSAAGGLTPCPHHGTEKLAESTKHPGHYCKGKMADGSYCKHRT